MKGGFKFTDPAVSAASAKVQQLVSHAQQCMQRYELDAALKFYEKVCALLICKPQVLSQVKVCRVSCDAFSGLLVQAVGLEPDNTDLLDAAGELCVEAGRSEDATKLFTRSIELKPNENSCKYMNLGMLAGECIRLASVSQLVFKLSRFGLHSSILNINVEKCFTGIPTSHICIYELTSLMCLQLATTV